MPHLRTLVKRMQGRPFTLIGVNTGDSPEAFRKGVEDFQVTWPVAYQGEETPIADLYRVQAYPTIYILDDKGVILSKSLRGEALVQKVEEYVRALEGASQ